MKIKIALFVNKLLTENVKISFSSNFMLLDEHIRSKPLGTLIFFKNRAIAEAFRIKLHN